ncbi:tetraacyldisaccharide 4'-kinase [Flavobacteriaceae bacterium TP-CH-4]|uniref:Tetraacyldisaccharide 4'-kinase n=1 Tax=Pelagihabitans pacificus TaxID=2696054 RepID=A0A967AVM8_9FLAO|nr:tetraacyldisaccharide 4'-kinase [Pelagihabitans pacificus]NHF60789.1 tetraacyldisaccharide 4'-kinase [Pelagihabitans pacificus]
MQLLRKIAFPISLIYALVVRLRNYGYDKGLFQSTSFKTPIICIGNLSVGGTGKTPMTEYLIRILKDPYRIAVLSRGYKRKSVGFVLGDSGSKVTDLGDEPFQMYQKFPKITVAVDANRQRGIETLEATVNPEVILLDDAFQHRKVQAGLYILLTAYGKLYNDDWYLPTGNLRDSKSQAQRANIIVVTKCPTGLSESERKQIITNLQPKEHQKVLFSYLDYGEAIIGDGTKRPLDFFKDGATLVTGIADPGPLLDYLQQQGIRCEHLRFKDHHFFTDNELQLFNSKNKLLTTEKDYVRLKDRVKNLYYIPIKHRFFAGDVQEFENDILDFMKQGS